MMKMKISFFIHQRMIKPAKKKNQKKDLSSFEQESDKSDLAIDQAFDQLNI